MLRISFSMGNMLIVHNGGSKEEVTGIINPPPSRPNEEDFEGTSKNEIYINFYQIYPSLNNEDLSDVFKTVLNLK